MKLLKSFFPKSIQKRLILLLTVCIIVPILIILGMVINESVKTNNFEIETAINNEVENAAGAIKSVSDSMRIMSQLMSEDGSIGKRLKVILNSDADSYDSISAVRGMRDELANYEISSKDYGNLTYFILNPYGELKKINLSLVREQLPDDKSTLAEYPLVTYYGPHKTLSRVASYQAVSLLRKFEFPIKGNDVYVYIESGYRRLEDMLPDEVQDLDCVCLTVSESGNVTYSNDESVIKAGDKAPEFTKNAKYGGKKYVSFSSRLIGNSEIRLLIPNSAYNARIYSMLFSVLTAAVIMVTLSLVVMVLLWRSIYTPFREFDNTLSRISSQSGDVALELKKMNVSEIDASFAYFSQMQQRIIKLLSKAQEEEKKRTELELKALMGKMNPHFIHNTLDTLKWYSDGKGYDDVGSFISALNKLLMYNMEKTGRATIESELAAIGDYITIQKLKYDIEFSCAVRLPRQMLKGDMPRFVLQPILENAILHGGASEVKIDLVCELNQDGRILISISNNGRPIDCEQIYRLLAAENDVSSNGIGLQYVARTLRARFGDECSINVESENGVNAFKLVFPYAID